MIVSGSAAAYIRVMTQDKLPEPAKDLPDAAKRALAEAAARRDAAAAQTAAPEFGGRNGPEPTRFGDWEKKGIAVDF
jgi:hypothetical protein